MKQIGSRSMLGAMFGACLLASASHAQEAEIMHWWASETDAAAVAKFAEAYKAAGGTWVDIATASSQSSLQATVTRILAGSPPDAAQFNTSTQFYDLVDGGKLNSLESEARAGKWREIIPGPLLDVAVREGQLYALPVSMSGVNIAFYNKKMLADAGIAEEPADWTDLLAAMRKVKASGKVPLALAGGVYPSLLFYSIMADHLGNESYTRMLIDRDPEVDAEGLRKTFETFSEIRDYVDAGWSGRKWNEASRMLAKGEAAFQVAGDWAKAEFALNSMMVGKDFGCVLPKGTVIVGGDVIVFPKKGDVPTPAQEKLIQIFADEKAQTAFNKLKGSLPARVDVNAGDFDACAQRVLAAAADKGSRLPRPRMIVPSDIEGDLGDFINEYFASQMSADEGVERFSELLQQ